MKAINGYLDNGRFMPLDVITLPSRVRAVLVFNETENEQGQSSWLEQFHAAVKRSASEELPDFPRTHIGRGLVDLSGEG